MYKLIIVDGDVYFEQERDEQNRTVIYTKTPWSRITYEAPIRDVTDWEMPPLDEMTWQDIRLSILDLLDNAHARFYIDHPDKPWQESGLDTIVWDDTPMIGFIVNLTKGSNEGYYVTIYRQIDKSSVVDIASIKFYDAQDAIQCLNRITSAINGIKV